MIIITTAQHKGGVGKTTSTLCIGQSLAMLGYRTLLVDTDPQHNLSSTFPDVEARHLGDVLQGQKTLAQVIQQVGGNLWLAPSHTSLGNLERSISGDVTHPFFLRKHLATVAGGYDFALIDTPPSLGPMTVMALVASRYVLAPMRPDSFSFAGFYKLLDMMDLVNENYNPALELKGAFLTQYHPSYRGRVYADFAEALTQNPRVASSLMQTSIRTGIKVVEAHALQEQLMTYAADSNPAQDYLALTKELLASL